MSPAAHFAEDWVDVPVASAKTAHFAEDWVNVPVASAKAAHFAEDWVDVPVASAKAGHFDRMTVPMREFENPSTFIEEVTDATCSFAVFDVADLPCHR